jgi:hypothetical protein
MGTTMGQLQKNKPTRIKRFTLERLFSQSNLLAWLLLIALLPLLMATLFTYQSAKKSLLEQVEERLSYIAQEKIYQIENYSENTPILIGKQIQQIPHEYKQLSKVFDDANTLMSVQISDIEMGENKLRPHFYLAAPVFESGYISGILVLSMPSYKIQEILTTIANLGHSGETLIA